ncbi:unnamed protein product [Prunus armeniaca]|uniref:Uncharacterized protein n=1 Tax=Prunus armeniaca TaxID=36596 RepID=A0A6J5WCX1_PRUAR|nr:unnamed protein product [Prunus armeniaca]
MAHNPEQEKKELNEKIELKLSQIREHDGRLSSLQTKGFQLGSFYLVFQGVILTAIANANSIFGCLSYWLLIALSSLAAFPNLIAMYYIGREYIRISNQRDISLRESDALFTQLTQLSQPNPTSSPGTSPFVSAPPAPPSQGAGTAPPPSQVAATAQPPPAGNHCYTSIKGMVTRARMPIIFVAFCISIKGMVTRARMRIIFVAFCIAFYLGVSAIMYFVCIKTLRKPGAQCKQH